MEESIISALSKESIKRRRELKIKTVNVLLMT